MNKISRMLDLLLMEASINDLCVYPMSINGIKRTEWQDGWNACKREINEKWSKAELHIDKINTNLHKIIEELLSADVLNMTIRHKEISFYLNMNDTFYFACSDTENVPTDSIEIIYELWNKFNHHGLTAWASIQRNEYPLKYYITSEFKEAIEFIKKKE